MKGILLGVGLLGAVISVLTMGGSVVALLAPRWPRVKGIVVWVGTRNEAIADHNVYDVTSLRAQVCAHFMGREYRLIFNNVPPAIRVGDYVWVRMCHFRPDIFHDYEDRWRDSGPYAYRLTKNIFGLLLSFLLLAVSSALLFFSFHP